MKEVLLFILSLTTSLTLMASEILDQNFRVAFAQDSLRDDCRSAQVKELESALLKRGEFEFFYSDADSSLSMQIMQVEDFIMRGVDVLLISALDVNVSSNVIAQAYDLEIPVILINREIESSKFSVFIDTSERNATKDANQILEAILKILSTKRLEKEQNDEL